jgi:hypothetical protein
MPDHQEQNELVSTGFEELAQPAAPAAPAEVPQPVQTASTTEEAPVAPVESKPEPDNFINIAQQGPPQLSETARLNKEMFDRIMESRKAPPAVVPVQPAIPHVLEQTKREMAEGAKQVAKATAARAAQAPRRPTPTDIAHTTHNTPVFRTGAEVPGMNSLSDAARGHKNL